MLHEGKRIKAKGQMGCEMILGTRQETPQNTGDWYGRVTLEEKEKRKTQREREETL